MTDHFAPEHVIDLEIETNPTVEQLKQLLIVEKSKNARLQEELHRLRTAQIDQVRKSRILASNGNSIYRTSLRKSLSRIG